MKKVPDVGKGLLISFHFALVVHINLIKIWYEVRHRGPTITLIKVPAFPACHFIRIMTDAHAASGSGFSDSRCKLVRLWNPPESAK